MRPVTLLKVPFAQANCVDEFVPGGQKKPLGHVMGSMVPSGQ
jgi:hypothetical protein